jgi:Fe2+ or Zn2+ uptake regulation protein
VIEDYQEAAAELKAVASPIRLAVLAAFEQGYRSPQEVFLLLNREDPQMNLALVGYHVGVLKKHHLIVETHTEKVRGATKHIYKVLPVGRMLLKVAEQLGDADDDALAP